RTVVRDMHVNGAGMPSAGRARPHVVKGQRFDPGRRRLRNQRGRRDHQHHEQHCTIKRQAQVRPSPFLLRLPADEAVRRRPLRRVSHSKLRRSEAISGGSSPKGSTRRKLPSWSTTNVKAVCSTQYPTGELSSATLL